MIVSGNTNIVRAGHDISQLLRECLRFGWGGCRPSSALAARATRAVGKQDYPICPAQLTLSGRAYRFC